MVDYFDTYAPVAQLAPIRVVLACAAILDLELHQVDTKGAYLNGGLEPNEKIYMKHPPGFGPPKSNTVLLLVRTLYRLRQSGRRWYLKPRENCTSTNSNQYDVGIMASSYGAPLLR